MRHEYRSSQSRDAHTCSTAKFFLYWARVLTSWRVPPDSSVDETQLDHLYNRLFGPPALSGKRGGVFSDVYDLATERLHEAEQAVEAARSEFYRGDSPFDYSVTESAATVGGQSS
jgi:hypothetical protein